MYTFINENIGGTERNVNSLNEKASSHSRTLCCARTSLRSSAFYGYSFRHYRGHSGILSLHFR